MRLNKLPEHIALATTLSEAAEFITDTRYNGVILEDHSYRSWPHPGRMKLSVKGEDHRNWREIIPESMICLGEPEIVAKIADQVIETLEELLWVIKTAARVEESDCYFDVVADDDVGQVPHTDDAIVAFKIIYGPGMMIWNNNDVHGRRNEGRSPIVDLEDGIMVEAGHTIVFRGNIEKHASLGDSEEFGLAHMGPKLSGRQRFALRVFCEMPSQFPFFD